MNGALREIEVNRYGFTESVEIPHPDRAQREEMRGSAPGRARPAWWLLYAMLPLTALAFRLADAVPTTSAWRSVSELVATLVIFLGIGLWLRLNRLALVRADCEERPDSPPELPLEMPAPPISGEAASSPPEIEG